MGYTKGPTCLTDEATGVLAEKNPQSFDNNLGFVMDLSLKHGRLLWGKSTWHHGNLRVLPAQKRCLTISVFRSSP